jgi:hypothetical protein
MALPSIVRWGQYLAAFAGSDENAVVGGDFAVTENELRKALKSLREAGINIVAIHSHMISEEPRIIFFRYWGRGSAQNRARMSGKNVGFCYKVCLNAVTISVQAS